MPYFKIWIHIVWTTKKRKPFLTKDIRHSVFEHIRKNAKLKGIHLDLVNGYVDHVHCLISMNGTQSIGKIVQLLKGESSFWINKNKLTRQKFEWQTEYYAVSVGPNYLENVRNYIRRQEVHHQKKSFGVEVGEIFSVDIQVDETNLDRTCTD